MAEDVQITVGTENDSVIVIIGDPFAIPQTFEEDPTVPYWVKDITQQNIEQWNENSGNSLSYTDNLPEGEINLYFTSDRVLSTLLHGLTLASIRTALTAADTILEAFSKISKFLSDLKAPAFSDFGDSIDTVARGNDTRIVNSLQKIAKTTAEWVAENPILPNGVLGISTDGNFCFFGNGATNYLTLISTNNFFVDAVAIQLIVNNGVDAEALIRNNSDNSILLKFDTTPLSRAEAVNKIFLNQLIENQKYAIIDTTGSFSGPSSLQVFYSVGVLDPITERVSISNNGIGFVKKFDETIHINECEIGYDVESDNWFYCRDKKTSLEAKSNDSPVVNAIHWGEWNDALIEDCQFMNDVSGTTVSDNIILCKSIVDWNGFPSPYIEDGNIQDALIRFLDNNAKLDLVISKQGCQFFLYGGIYMTTIGLFAIFNTCLNSGQSIEACTIGDFVNIDQGIATNNYMYLCTIGTGKIFDCSLLENYRPEGRTYSGMNSDFPAYSVNGAPVNPDVDGMINMASYNFAGDVYFDGSATDVITINNAPTDHYYRLRVKPGATQDVQNTGNISFPKIFGSPITLRDPRDFILMLGNDVIDAKTYT